MNSKLFAPKFLALAGLLLLAAFTRFIPHPPNFTAIGAIALMGGAYFNKKIFAFAVPLAAMFLTDLIIGFHNTIWAVYVSFALIVVVGMTMLKTKKITNMILASVSASVLFFILTNFAFWMTGTMYPVTGAGLAACFTAAIPFFHYNLIGDLLFVGLLFGVFELARAKYPVLSKAGI